MRRIKIAQIGASETTHASQVFKSLTEQKDIFEVVGFADVDAHRNPLPEVYRTTPQMKPEELLDYPGLDAVAVECDEVLLTKYGRMAAEKGLHIHFEKPGSESDEAYDQLIDLVARKGLVFHTGYMYRYNPAVRKALEVVRSGKLGEIYSVEAQMNCLHGSEMRRWFHTFRGGMMFYLGCHLVDLIYQLQGEPDEVLPMNMGVGVNDIHVNDYGMAIFKYGNGLSFAKTCAVEPGGFLRRQLVICGTRGTIEIKPLERLEAGDMISTEMTESYSDENGALPWAKEGIHTTYECFNRYDGMMRGFAEMVRGERSNPYDYEYERRLHKLILKACGF